MGQSVSAELITAIILGILQLLLSIVSIWQQRHLGHLTSKTFPSMVDNFAEWPHSMDWWWRRA